MVTSDRPPANGFVSTMRKVYNPIGFSKGYNALLWFIFDGALFGFVLSRFEYLNFSGVFCSPNPQPGNAAGPGECYWYTRFPRNYYGIMIHLATILPAGLLAVFQFIPAIRHKALLYHRMAGYVIVLLVLLSNGSAVAITNHAFGGDVITRVFVGLLAIFTTTSLFLAIYNVKRLQIEEHRAWMLRTWFYMGSIVTLRILQIMMIAVSARWGGEAQQYAVKPCEELLFVDGGNTSRLYAKYPMCAPGNAQYAPDGMVVVKADFPSASGSTTSDATNIGAAQSVNFGAAGILAFLLHAIGVEIYLRLTPREGERLRRISYEKQLERGFKNPGSAGLTVDRLGDADPWVPRVARKESDITLAAPSHGETEGKRDVSPMALPTH